MEVQALNKLRIKVLEQAVRVAEEEVRVADEALAVKVSEAKRGGGHMTVMAVNEAERILAGANEALNQAKQLLEATRRRSTLTDPSSATVAPAISPQQVPFQMFGTGYLV